MTTTAATTIEHNAGLTPHQAEPEPGAIADDGPGLYLHVPFCSAICPYCDFAVTTGGATARRSYVDHLLVEIDRWSRPEANDQQPFRLPRDPFTTVYLGGGTPSLLADDDLDRLLTALSPRLARPTGRPGEPTTPWISLEANPEDVTVETCARWRSQGVATLSLGVQSFDNAELRYLGRRHDTRAATQAVEVALAAGFHTVSVDLIYGLPGQTAASWRANLRHAIELAPQHLSCYQLTIHGGTKFGRLAARGQLRELAEPEQATLFTITHELLADAGWPAYEVSNFARSPTHRSRHNQKYWNHTPYLGLGPAAHSLLVDRDGIVPPATRVSVDGETPAEPARARRFWNERHTGRWQTALASGRSPVADSETLGADQLALESVMLGLRRLAGIDLATLRDHLGVDLLAANQRLVAQLIDEGLLAVDADARGRPLRLRPKPAGLAVADGLAARFVLRAG